MSALFKKGLICMGLYYLMLRIPAQGATTTEQSVISPKPETQMDLVAPYDPNLLGIYWEKMEKNKHLLRDRFGAQNGLELMLERASDRGGFFRNQGKTMYQGSQQLFLDSGRDALVQSLPLKDWQDSLNWGKFGDFVENILYGSVGTYGTRIHSTSASFTESDAAWEEESLWDTRVRYGLHPESRYAYVGGDLGSYEGLPILSSDIRAYCTDQGTGLISSQISLHLSKTVSLVNGFSCDPADMRSRSKNPPIISVRLEKTSHGILDTLFAGVSFNSQTIVRVGASIRF